MKELKIRWIIRQSGLSLHIEVPFKIIINTKMFSAQMKTML
jgi:hypothetical protein